jgi:hypothetical protein
MSQALTLPNPINGLQHTASRIQRGGVALVRAYPRETLAVAIVGGLAAAVLAGTAIIPSSTIHPTVVPPPPPMVVRAIAPEQALKLNAEIPIAAGPNPTAMPFVFRGDAAARGQAVNCLASAVYYEAGNQDEEGARAVAQVVLNRVRHPAFPASICGVVYQGSTRPTGCQFTFTCDGSLNRQPDVDGWRRATQIAQAAIAGSVYAPIGWATHYHADYVVPYWVSTMSKNAVVGAHLFYRWAGAWGQPGVFTKAYLGREPSAAALRSAALAAVHVIPAHPGGVAEAIRAIPGAEPLKLSPSLRGDKRVAVRFNLTARKAAETAPRESYDKRFTVSDNLKWSLSGESTATNELPLGRRSEAAAAGGSGASVQH